ncbi:Rib/alpha-like domain-containing protein, partial [Corynebacterium glutamicum]
MKRMKTLTGLFAAVALSVSALVTPVAVAQTEASEQVNEVTAPVVAPNSDDRSQQCNLDYNSQTIFKADGSVEEHNSKVYNPFEQKYIPKSAGFLEVHGWGENRRIITGTVYPLKNAALSVTFPEGTDMGALNFSADKSFLWDGREGYGTFGDVYKNKVTDVSNRTVNGTTVTINLGDLAAGAALNLMAQGLVIQGQVDAKLTGTWDPLDVANTPNLGEQYKGIVEQVRPDCFRPQEKPADGDRSNVCEVAWGAGVIVDRRYLDWTNNGYTKKIAPGIFADHVGNMEIQHYIAGPDLYLRIPVVTDADIQNAKLTVELPALDGKNWTFAQYSDRTFGVVNDAEYTNLTPAAPVIEGNTATINVGNFNAGSRFTVLFKVPMTTAELDEATAVVDGAYSNAVQANATLTGFYPNGAAGTECGYTFGYDDSFTHPGVEVEVNQTGELNPPAGTNYEVILENGEPKVTDADGNLYTDWTVTVDERTGHLTITPPADTAYDTKYWVHVRATTQDGATQDLTAGVQVAQTITKTEIRADGHLWVLVNNQWIDLGKVVGAPGQPGEPGEPGQPGEPGE